MEEGNVVPSGWSPPKDEDPIPVCDESMQYALAHDPARVRPMKGVALNARYEALRESAGSNPIALHNVGAGTSPLQNAARGNPRRTTEQGTEAGTTVLGDAAAVSAAHSSGSSLAIMAMQAEVLAEEQLLAEEVQRTKTVASRAKLAKALADVSGSVRSRNSRAAASRRPPSPDAPWLKEFQHDLSELIEVDREAAQEATLSARRLALHEAQQNAAAALAREADRKAQLDLAEEQRVEAERNAQLEQARQHEREFALAVAQAAEARRVQALREAEHRAQQEAAANAAQQIAIEYAAMQQQTKQQSLALADERRRNEEAEVQRAEQFARDRVELEARHSILVAEARQVVERQATARMQELAEGAQGVVDEQAELRIREQNKEYWKLIDANAVALRDQKENSDRELARLRSVAEARMVEELRAYELEREATRQQ